MAGRESRSTGAYRPEEGVAASEPLKLHSVQGISIRLTISPSWLSPSWCVHDRAMHMLFPVPAYPSPSETKLGSCYSVVVFM